MQLKCFVFKKILEIIDLMAFLELMGFFNKLSVILTRTTHTHTHARSSHGFSNKYPGFENNMRDTEQKKNSRKVLMLFFKFHAFLIF